MVSDHRAIIFDLEAMVSDRGAMVPEYGVIVSDRGAMVVTDWGAIVSDGAWCHETCESNLQ
jgi:hypothetical protein